jgi:hypothetical protein
MEVDVQVALLLGVVDARQTKTAKSAKTYDVTSALATRTMMVTVSF